MNEKDSRLASAGTCPGAVHRLDMAVMAAENTRDVLALLLDSLKRTRALELADGESFRAIFATTETLLAEDLCTLCLRMRLAALALAIAENVTPESRLLLTGQLRERLLEIAASEV